MNTLNVGSMVPFMRRNDTVPVSGVAQRPGVSLLEGLSNRAVHTPPERRKQWAVWGWNTGQPFVLVDVGATGATIVNLYNSPDATWPHSALRSLPADLEVTFADIDALKDLNEGWNGYDVAAPRIEAIHDATEWIEQMYWDVVHFGLAWRQPHVAADETGDVTFEWWNGDKGLTIYVSVDGSVTYLKDWGPDMDDDMEDGPVSTSAERRELWAWLIQQ